MFRGLTLHQKLGLALSILPAAWLGIFLFSNVVNVPFWDQWELVPIIQHVHNGNFVLHDFWQQHNEHRIFFPRIIMIATAIVTHWNTGAEALVGFFLAVVSFVLLLMTLRRTLRNRPFPIWLPLLLGAIWFSIVQWENWLWGWQIQWFLSVLGVVSVLYALTYIDEHHAPWDAIIMVIAGGILAQYSLGNGILVWLPVGLILLYMRVGKAKIFTVGGVASVTTALYYINYHNPGNNPPKSFALHHPLAFIKYFFGYIGRSITYNHRLATIIGVMLVGLFVGLVIYLYRLKQRDRFTAAAPWIALGLYALLSAAVTDLSRLGLGLGQAFTSRYTTISSLLLVSLIILVTQNADVLMKAFGRKFSYAAILSGFLLCILLLLNMHAGYNDATKQVRYLRDIQQCTHYEEPPRVCLLSAYPNEQTVSERLSYLKQIHWGGY